jgi:hypothetical protein
MNIIKKAVLLVIFTSLFSNPADAQWYEKKCGVIDINFCSPEEYECLESQIRMTFIQGSASLAVGTPLLIGGNVMVKKANNSNDEEERVTNLVAGILLVSVGGILYSTGIPILMVGVVRKTKLNNSLNYKNYKEGSLGLSPAIGYNQLTNSCNYGVTLSFTF